MVQQQLQVVVDIIEEWTIRNYFNVSESKTKVVHFINEDSMLQTPALYMNDLPVEVVKEVKFLLLYFDRLLNWKAYTEKLKGK